MHTLACEASCGLTPELALCFAGHSGQAHTPDRQRSVAAVLESAGWGATSPDKRVTPPQKSVQAANGNLAASRHLADYEAMLPAQPQPARTVPIVSPE